MLKKLSVAPILALAFAVIFVATAFAAGNDFQTLLNQANANIQNEIAKAQNDANKALNTMNARIAQTTTEYKRGLIPKNVADGRIANYKLDFENLLKAISDRLITNTDGIVVTLKAEANRRHIKIVVEYVEVILAGRIYLVDPLRIVGN